MAQSKLTPGDLPLDVIETQINELLAKNPHAQTYQKFTCEKCGRRQTMEAPNTLYISGQCEECKHVTDISKKGCGYMAAFSVKSGDKSV
jgi:hypothetical protein